MGEHKAGCTLSVFHIRHYFRRFKLMPIQLADIILFSYFCVACENSEFCYYIFSHNSFDFSRKDRSMCESYAIHKPQNAIYKKPAKTGLRTSPFSRYRTL